MKMLAIGLVILIYLPHDVVGGESIRITRNGIQTCYQGAASLNEVLEALQNAKDLAPIDPIPLVPSETTDPDPNPLHWRIVDPYSLKLDSYVWLPSDREKIKDTHFPYGKIVYGSGFKIFKQPHVQGTMYRAYIPKDVEGRGLVQVKENHGPGGLLSPAVRYYPAFAFQKFSLWKHKESEDEIYLADHASDELHLLWKRFKSPEGWGDYWYNTITDQIWSAQFDSLNLTELEAKASRLNVEFDSKGFRVPKLSDYRMGTEMSIQHSLPGYADPGKYMLFNQLEGPVQYWVSSDMNPDVFGSFYADGKDVLDDHWAYKKSIEPAINRRARLVLDVSKEETAVQNALRSKFNLQPMDKEVALNIMKRRHDPRAVVPRGK